MRTLAKILRTIGRWLTWPPAWEYAAPRQFGPWHYYRYPCYRYPSRFEDAPTDLAMKAQQVLASGETTPEEIAAFVAEHFGPEYGRRSDGNTQVS
jgi:4-aminobutyrate aminotransferase-like enzyme